MKRKAFTLVELLVVLAIIMILASLLFAAVHKAREKAVRVRCLNNLHQIGIACHNFHAVNGVFPANDGFSWYDSIYPYDEWQGKRRWCCPAALHPGNYSVGLDESGLYNYNSNIGGLSIVQIRRESSNTVLAYDRLVSYHKTGFNTLFCDGRVEWMAPTFPMEWLSPN